MSVEEAVTEGLLAPLDQNAQAAEEAKRMLAELEGEAAPADEPVENNGAKKEDTILDDSRNESDSEKKEEPAAKRKANHGVEDEAREHRQDRNHHRREDGDRRGYHGRGRGRGRGGRGSHRGGGRDRDHGDSDSYKPRSFKENIKSDLTTQEVTDNPEAIRKQIHFYFSDSNLPQDSHLFSLTGGLANKPVSLETIHTFKRMRRFQPFEAIVNALRDSDEVELAENDTAVRRKHPLPEDYFEVVPARSDPRTVYVKGFGEETSGTQFDIEAFFIPYGPTKQVRLRRNNEQSFKGSVFVEFDTEELAETFLNLDPKPKYKDRDLQIMSKKDYQDKKSEDLKAGRITSNNDGRRGGRGGYREKRGSFDYDKRDRDRDYNRDWRELRDEDQKRGFKDDYRRGDRDRGNRGKKPSWTGGGRTRAPDTDERGIPTIKSTTLEKDKDTSEAIANAKAAVQAESKKEQDEQEAANNVESTEQDGDADASTKAANAVADSVQDDVEAVTGKKRAHEDDHDGEAEREIKKVDTKTEEQPVKAES